MYLVAKYFHIIGIISWMAGVLYLYRLFIYQFDHRNQSKDLYQVFTMMERRLFSIITLPAMIVALASASVMIFLNPGLLDQNWFRVKLISGIFLAVFTLYGKSLIARFIQKDIDGFTSRKLRLLNEVPTLLMFLIVAMVIFRPGF